MTATQAAVKRATDILFSFFGLLVLWPIIVICTIVARIDTGESGLFKQLRVGRHAKFFHVLKIRTMRSSSSDPKHTTITTSNDSRITCSGRFMRQLKLDELPQLWNVLTGEMSLVGPRPDVPGYADKISGHATRVLDLRPGITGPATIKYKNEERLLSKTRNPIQLNNTLLFPDKTQLNLNYIDNWTYALDIKLILITVGLHIIPKELNLDEAAIIEKWVSLGNE